MSDIRVGIPRVSGQGGIPEPFNLNDVLVWKAFICKFICYWNKDRFTKSTFLEMMIKGEVGPIPGAYDRNEMQKATSDNNHVYSRLIGFCMDDLVKKDLFKKYEDLDYDSYLVTGKLKMLCPQILKYDFAGIDELVKSNDDSLKVATAEVEQGKHRSEISNLLKRLAAVNQMPLEEALRYLDKRTLERLIENGSVTLYLDNKIAISFLGLQVLTKLSQ